MTQIAPPTMPEAELLLKDYLQYSGIVIVLFTNNAPPSSACRMVINKMAAIDEKHIHLVDKNRSTIRHISTCSQLTPSIQYLNSGYLQIQTH